MSTPPGPRWAAVIVNHNAGSLLDRCVRSVLADDSAGSPEVVVVDNDSRDGSADDVERAHPSITVVRAPGNLGYARGANLGIAATRAPIVAVMNPDALLEPGGGAAVAIERFEHDSTLGALGPRVLNPDGSDYPSARVHPGAVVAAGHGILGLFWPRNPFTRRYRQLDADPSRARLVDWVSGCAIWLRRSALDAVGGWDERYFMYMEEVDLCERLREQAWSIAYDPSIRVEHVQGVSTSARPYRMIVEHHRSLWRFARSRYHGARRLVLPVVLLLLLARAAMALGRHALLSQMRPSTR